jgi:hypothetical protein
MKISSDILPNDTKLASVIKQFSILRKMDTNKRAEMTFQLGNNLRSIVESGIRQRHPGYSDEQIKLAALKLTIDKDLFNRAFPGCKVSV